VLSLSEFKTLSYKQGAQTLRNLTYTYDAAGNRIKTGGSFARSTIPPALASVTYNANNQQTTFGSVTETYDLNGNLATVTEAGITTTYAWNARNQLTGISNPGFSASFSYDSFGRRTGKTIAGATTNFVYDGLNPVQEKNGSTVTANLLTGLGIDEFFTRTDGVGARALLTDALGSTVALGDGTGSLVTQYTYEPFGYTTESGSASTNSFKYTGREDDGSGLLYYRARYYHPRLQRFISEDPIGFLGSLNLYEYVGNNPVMRVDPSGLIPVVLCSIQYNALPPQTQDVTTGTELRICQLQACLGRQLIITGGSEPGHRSRSHTIGLAADFGFGANPGLGQQKAKFMCCAKQAGFLYGIQEGPGGDALPNNAPQFHISRRLGPNGITGAITCVCNK